VPLQGRAGTGVPGQRHPEPSGVELPIFYKGTKLPSFYKADFVCFEGLIVEAKAIKTITDIDRAQTINYLKATRLERALLLNFGTPSLQYERLVNRFAH
jgi:GxxExxY protein